MGIDRSVLRRERFMQCFHAAQQKLGLRANAIGKVIEAVIGEVEKGVSHEPIVRLDKASRNGLPLKE
jgi:hypothetical protein